LERLEESTLSDCNLIDQVTFERKQKRLVTKNLFEQQKFNLFREESEGYTKL
jgi:THO complex subunit 2